MTPEQKARREHVALQAMTGILSSKWGKQIDQNGEQTIRVGDIVNASLVIADTMIAALDAPPKQASAPRPAVPNRTVRRASGSKNARQ